MAEKNVKSKTDRFFYFNSAVSYTYNHFTCAVDYIQNDRNIRFLIKFLTLIFNPPLLFYIIWQFQGLYDDLPV